MSSDSLDQTAGTEGAVNTNAQSTETRETHQTNLDLAAEPPQEHHETPTQPKKKSSFGLIIILIVFFLFVVAGAGGAYWVYMQTQSQNDGFFNSASRPEFGTPQPESEKPVTEPISEPVKGSVQRPIFKTSEPANTAEKPRIFAEPESFGSVPSEVPLTAQSEKPIYELNAPGEAGTGVEPPNFGVQVRGSNTELEQGKMSLSEKEVDQIQDELASVKLTMNELSERFDALDQVSGRRIDQLSHSQLKMNSVLITLKSQLTKVEQSLSESSSSQEAIQKALVTVKKANDQVDTLAKQAAKNDKNVKWLSRERLCLIEQSLGITKYKTQCSKFNKRSRMQAGLAVSGTRSQPQRMAPVQQHPPKVANNSQQSQIADPAVPVTVGVLPAQAPIANTQLLQSHTPQNPCDFADRTWKIQLMGQNQAMLYRATDGYQTIVEMHSKIPGLGRAQLFESSGYPQYVQFTNGIVCGG